MSFPQAILGSNGATPSSAQQTDYGAFFDRIQVKTESEAQFLSLLPNVASGAAQQLIESEQQQARGPISSDQNVGLHRLFKPPVCVDLRRDWVEAANPDDDGLSTESGDWVDVDPQGQARALGHACGLPSRATGGNQLDDQAVYEDCLQSAGAGAAPISQASSTKAATAEKRKRVWRERERFSRTPSSVNTCALQVDEHGMAMLDLGKAQTPCILDAPSLAVQVDNLTGDLQPDSPGGGTGGVASGGAQLQGVMTAYVPSAMMGQAAPAASRASLALPAPAARRKTGALPSPSAAPVMLLESMCPRGARPAAACSDSGSESEGECMPIIPTEARASAAGTPAQPPVHTAGEEAGGGGAGHQAHHHHYSAGLPGSCEAAAGGDTSAVLTEQLLHAMGGEGMVSQLGLADQQALAGTVDDVTEAAQPPPPCDVHDAPGGTTDDVAFDTVEAFSLDPTFDYDNAKLTPRNWPPQLFQPKP